MTLIYFYASPYLRVSIFLLKIKFLFPFCPAGRRVVANSASGVPAELYKMDYVGSSPFLAGQPNYKTVFRIFFKISSAHVLEVRKQVAAAILLLILEASW